MASSAKNSGKLQVIFKSWTYCYYQSKKEWYLRYNLGSHNLVEMIEEGDLSVAQTTIMSWVYQYEPELDKRVRCYFKTTNDSWRVDETYMKVKGQ